jgi:hypothetical protein
MDGRRRMVVEWIGWRLLGRRRLVWWRWRVGELVT